MRSGGLGGVELRRQGNGARSAAQKTARAAPEVEAPAELGEQGLREREALLYRGQKAAALAYLAGGIAHDFNNLLTVIVGAADLLREDPRVENDLRAELAQIQRAGARACEITQQLLAYSRREPSVPRTLDLAGQVQGLASLLQLQLGSNIRLELSLPTDLWALHVDPRHIEHVVMHLGAQARQTMPHGGVLWLSLKNLTIESFERHAGLMVGPGEYVQLSVRDTGAGLSQAAQAHVFEPFFAPRSGAGSADLGLPLVRQLVVQAFGHIWLESEPGRGSAFTVLWPRAGSRSSAPPLSSLLPEPAAAPNRAPTRRGKRAVRGARPRRKA
jgi:two-component system, cell cycle sensor histidine kinase and response regulator CckA